MTGKRDALPRVEFLFDLAMHHIDLIHYVLQQPVAEVSAQLASTNSEHDTAWLRMTLQNGIVVQSFFCLYGTDTNRFEIFGESARLTVDYVAKNISKLLTATAQSGSAHRKHVGSRSFPSEKCAWSRDEIHPMEQLWQPS